MPPLEPEAFYAEIGASTAALADLVSEADPALPVPACPGWTLRNLATHVGRAHRWAAEITTTRSAEFIPFRAVPDGKFPDDRPAQPAWLNAGAQRVVAAVREAGSDPVWAFGSLQPATFWGRRMAHETALHRADAELATGREPMFAPGLAADAIDEWLSFLSGPVYDRPDPRLEALPAGRALHVHATDGELAGTGEWLVRHDQSAIHVDRGHAQADVAIRGQAARLLLVLTRRVPPGDPAVQVFGDPALLSRWLEHTPL
jgi:uncharacterized protein (TIGR03083 family)